MTLIIILLALSLVATLPFLLLRRPWAIQLWRRIHIVLIVYAVVIFVAAVVRLVFNWDEIYG